MAFIQEVTEIPISQIELGPVPTVPDALSFEANIDELADSIKRIGLLQPIVVCKAAKGKYQLLAGRRRVFAHVKYRAPHIMAAIIEDRVDVATGNSIWLTENLVRQVSEADAAGVIAALSTTYGSARAIAEHTGLPLEKLRRYTRR